jgi:hypothetical protein
MTELVEREFPFGVVRRLFEASERRVAAFAAEGGAIGTSPRRCS